MSIHRYDREKVRHLLEAVLKRLNEERRGDEQASEPVLVERLPTESPDSGDPVILIVLNDLKAGSQRVDETKYSAMLKSPHSNDSETKVSHPGLESFTIIQPDPHPTAPKACFIEPGRECVNSGACELRGF